MAVLILSAALAAAQTPNQAQLPLMPWPAQVNVGAGTLAIDGQFGVASDGCKDLRIEALAARVMERVARQTGLLLSYRVPGPRQPAVLVFECKGTGEDESYSLDVTPQQARIIAATPVGVLRGAETFLQLIRPAGDGLGVPVLKIEDRPRFAWRGLMIDSARHYMPMEMLKRTLDGMAAVKLNVLHWHVSDDQGFRIESKRFPKLHQMGSDGLYYTQDQVREVIAYAAERGIRVVPEFDMPGHTTSWFVGYPELASGPGPYKIERQWGIFDPALDPTNEEVYKFLDGLIGEMAALFPDPYFHIGGDEVNGNQWKANPKIAAFMREKGMKGTEQLQEHFSRRVLPIVTKHGKKTIGWDEIFQPGLPEDAVIHSWRGPKALAAAAKQGYRGILSNGYYIDLIYPAAQHYKVDPQGGAAASLTHEEKARIMGGEATMWAEFVSPETVDSRIWPRTAAIAERLWSPQSVTDIDSMYTRMDAVSRWLEWSGLHHRSNYEKMLERLTAGRPTEHLRILADVVEPVKEYRRGQLRKATQQMPLNRLVDAARPESDTAREFSKRVNALMGGDKSQAEAVRRQLIVWRDNHEALKPLLTNLLAEAVPLSENLSALAAAALNAFEGKPMDPTATAALAKRARAPHGEVLLMVVPALEKLAVK
jgi:hexosaminidase